MTESDCPKMTLCRWQGVKIQLLTPSKLISDRHEMQTWLDKEVSSVKMPAAECKSVPSVGHFVPFAHKQSGNLSEHISLICSVQCMKGWAQLVLVKTKNWNNVDYWHSEIGPEQTKGQKDHWKDDTKSAQIFRVTPFFSTNRCVNDGKLKLSRVLTN